MNATENFIPKQAAVLLERWYLDNCRDLPWRKDRNPYRVLVSEAMLQQTQVSRVIDYYQQWMKRFPTLTSLAAAPEEEALHMWRGLGYYSRCRNLLKAAHLLVEAGFDTVPSDTDVLATLPGLGTYTLGAVLSIAYDLPVPAVDGNVRRVMTRLLNLAEDPSKGTAARVITSSVAEMLNTVSPHIMTQALMELGATVCLPACHCDSCPLKELCRARELGVQSERPVTAPRPKVKRRRGAALLVRDGERFWTRVRASKGLWAGFCEIPWLVGEDGESQQSCLTRLLNELGLSGPCDDTGLEETFKFTSWNVKVHLWRLSAKASPDVITMTTVQLSAAQLPLALRRLLLRGFEEGEQLRLPEF